MKCPRCQAKEKQNKVGFNPSSSQKYRCYECSKNYTPKPNGNGYPAEVRLKAIKLYLEGNSFRSIERLLKVKHQSVANWVREYSERLPTAQVPEKPKVAELDELSLLLARKKTNSMYLR